MRRTVTIPLAPDEEIRTPTGTLKAIVVREPSYAEYLEFGDPYVVAGSQGGSAFMVENAEVIKSYIALCLVEPKDPALLEQSSALVAKQVKEGILSFFQRAAATGEGSATSPTNSSSAASGSAPATPAA